MLQGYKKVRLADENNLNGETAWAYGVRINKFNYEPNNLRLILDNNTEYFPVGTELILAEDEYTVDMLATRELFEAKKIIDKYHSWTRVADATSKVTRKLIREKNLSHFIGRTIETKQGDVTFESLGSDQHDIWLVGLNSETGEKKHYSDAEWIAQKLGFDKESISLLLS